MKHRIFIILFISSLALCLLAFIGCSDATNHEGKVKVVFELEGGTYLNSDRPVSFYYDFEPGTSHLIYPADSDLLGGNAVTRANYHLEGWYRTKTGEGDGATYGEKWNFETDTVSDDGVTLYACWKKNIMFTYNFGYLDADNVFHSVSVAEADAGDTLDYYKRRATRVGYTAVEYYDENGNVWNDAFTHPGNEEQPEVKVVVQYVEGLYKVVKTASELAAGKNGNIYLAADIDMKGAVLDFRNYAYVFEGNGHVVSDFSVGYTAGDLTERDDDGKSNLPIGLFEGADGAVVRNVTFRDVSVTVSTGYSRTDRIIVAPLAVYMKNMTVSRVTFEGTYVCTRVPDGFDRASDLIYVTDEAYYQKDENSSVEHFTADITTD